MTCRTHHGEERGRRIKNGGGGGTQRGWVSMEGGMYSGWAAHIGQAAGG